MITTRLVTLDDARILSDLLLLNREFLAPWRPVRDEAYFGVEGQRADLETALELHARGMALPHLVLDDDGRAIGRITLSGIVRGPFQSCSLGYWVGAADNGRGVATAAVARLKQLAFDDLGLHRVQAETLLHNLKSQRVLERNGFVRFGMAPDYLHIAGRWQDHAVYQVLRPDAG